MNLLDNMIARAKANTQRVVLPEGSEERTLRATDRLSLIHILRIQFIGETASSIDKKTHKTLFENYPHIPWKQIYSMRNYISHQYADIDPEMILVTIHKHLPPLQHTVKQIITDLKSTIA